VGRLVLTNCESYDKFPPDALKRASAPSRTLPRLARALLRLQLRAPYSPAVVAAAIAEFVPTPVDSPAVALGHRDRRERA
jgi:hypothetical protein